MKQILTKMFRCVLISNMQLNKASKKTRKTAEETKLTAPETNAAAEATPNPRTTRSSKTKKTEMTETGTVKHRHNKANGGVAAAPASIIVDAVGVVTPAVEPETPSARGGKPGQRREATQQEIAELAYSYWIARGYSHGGAEEDWLRAERELQGR